MALIYVKVRECFLEIQKRRADHEEKRIAVMLTYIDTYIFPILFGKLSKKVTQAGGILQIAMTDNSVAKERMHLEEFLRTRRIDGLIAEPVKSGLPNPNLDLYQKITEIRNTGCVCE